MSKHRPFSPISHHFNRDPEVIGLRREFGDWIALAWIELLHEADRNDGFVSGSLQEIAEKMAPVSLQKYLGRASNAARTALERMKDNHWFVERSKGIEIVNYWKYHRSHDAKGAPPNQTKPIYSSYKNTQSQKSASPTPSAGLQNEEKKTREERHMVSMNLSPELKKETDRLYYSDPVKFKRLAAWVAQGRKHGYLESDMAAALREFWDYRQIDEWYPYLDTVLERVVKDVSIKTSTEAHEREKAEIEEWGKNARNGSEAILGLVKGVVASKGVK